MSSPAASKVSLACDSVASVCGGTRTSGASPGLVKGGQCGVDGG